MLGKVWLEHRSPGAMSVDDAVLNPALGSAEPSQVSLEEHTTNYDRTIVFAYGVSGPFHQWPHKRRLPAAQISWRSFEFSPQLLC